MIWYILTAMFAFSAGTLFGAAWCSAGQWRPDDDTLLHKHGDL